MKFDPAKHDEAAAAAVEVMKATRAEEGNEGYTFSADLEEPGLFHISERWTSNEALDAHMTTPHMATFMGAMGGLGISGGEVVKWEGATPTKIM
jgi:quinol monooxygenase YgiN